MAIGWYIVPYKIRIKPWGARGRYPAIDDYTGDIYGSGGEWAETEVLGNRCIVKVRAPLVVLTALDAVTGFKRIPKNYLDDPLSDLPQAALLALRNEAIDMGYTIQEINARFPGGLDAYTLRDVLRFYASRRLKWSGQFDAYDEPIWTTTIQTPRSIESVDIAVTE